jgi:hypothetical protein
MFMKLDPVQLETVTGGNLNEAFDAGYATAQRAYRSIDPAGPPTSNVFANAGRLASLVPLAETTMLGAAGWYGIGKNLLGQAKDGVLARLARR